MRHKFDAFILGLMLIAAGGLLMARNLGYEIDLTPTFGMVVFAALSALSFIRYVTGDLKRWGRLMPACLFAAFAVMIGLSEADVPDSIITAPLFIGLAIPFAVAAVADPQKNNWAAIPLSIFSLLAVAALLSNRTGDAVLVALTTSIMAVPFFFVHFTQPKQWWAIIPAGIFSSIGLTAFLAAINPTLEHSNVLGMVVSLGFAATFGVLYLRRHTLPTEWAKFPAIVFSFVALIALVSSTGIDGGPLVLIAVGVSVLVSSLHSRRTSVT